MKRNFMEKTGDFILGRGFYMVLLLCVATIGFSGYLVLRQPSQKKNPVQVPATGGASVVIDEGSKKPPQAVIPPTPTPSVPAKTQEPAKTQQTPEVKEETPSSAASQTKDKPAAFVWPLSGQIQVGHSLETLCFNETMGDWRIHSGIDIAADVGTTVVSISAGTVSAVLHDDMMGDIVVISHAQGVESRYCNLSANIAVKEGDSVETGAIIGTVGNTAIAESGQLPHLHLDVSKDGIAVDPADFLPKET